MKSIYDTLFFVSKKTIYNSDKIALKQRSDMCNRICMQNRFSIEIK